MEGRGPWKERGCQELSKTNERLKTASGRREIVFCEENARP